MSALRCELLLQTAISLLYKSIFAEAVTIEVADTVVKRRKVEGKVEFRVQKKELKTQKAGRRNRKKLDPALEELLDSEDQTLVVRRQRKKPAQPAATYREMILAQELLAAKEAQLAAESVVAELMRTQKAAVKPEPKPEAKPEPAKPPLSLPQKQRKCIKILGVVQAEYSTIRTVEIPKAVEVVPTDFAEECKPANTRQKERLLPYVLLRCRNWSVRPEPGETFECIRIGE